MPSRAVPVVLLAAALSSSCLRYEFEHEFWVGVDGTGTVYVTGTPALWTAFKGLGRPDAPEQTATAAAARALFEASGLRVRRAAVTRRRGRAYLFVSAEFADINRLAGTPAFPDLRLGVRREGEQILLSGAWAPPAAGARAAPPPDGLAAVRFHLAGKVYEHHNAAGGVERGNIVGWRQPVADALGGRPLSFGARYDARSILWSTVTLFSAAIVGALALLGLALYWGVRRGRRALAEGG